MQHPPPNTRMTASSSPRRHGVTARVHRAQGTQNRPFRDREPAPSCPGIRSQKETEIDDSTFTLQPVAIRTARTADDALCQADQEDLTAPTGYNILPLRFFSRWSGRYSEARQPRSKGGSGAQRHNHDESKEHPTRSRKGEPLKTQTWTIQNAKARTKRAIRQKTHPSDVRRSSTEPQPSSEEPERHPRKDDNWTGPPQPKALRE